MRKVVLFLGAAALGLLSGTLMGSARGQQSEKAGGPTSRPSSQPAIRGSLNRTDFQNPEYREIAGQIMGRANVGKEPRVGQPAPDFSLSPIKFYDFKTDDTDITIENADLLYQPVQLSHFRDKKPVALIFGSYT